MYGWASLGEVIVIPLNLQVRQIFYLKSIFLFYFSYLNEFFGVVLSF